MGILKTYGTSKQKTTLFSIICNVDHHEKKKQDYQHIGNKFAINVNLTCAQ